MSLPPQEPMPMPPPGQQPAGPAVPAPRKGLSTGGIVAIVASAVALALCLGAGILVVIGLRIGDEVQDAVDQAGQPTAGAACAWLPEAGGNPNLRDVGTPPTDVPNTGAQTMTMTTNTGVIEIEVATAKAPCAAASMTYLADKKFFDGSPCHRVTTEGIQVLQCGDPTGTGMGGPTYRYAEENLPNDIDPAKNYPIGTIAMAKTQDPASTGSQFFIVWGPSPLDGDYTVLGAITKGLDVAQKIGAAGAVDPDTGSPTTDGKPADPVTVTSITITPAR
jgi:peptidyl-prolyl cis-trans isomerase B (cyclophilin B)